jgi:hypothetical protein
MSFWLVYTRCENCPIESCLQCHREDRSLTLHVVEADDMPENSLNGPCETPEYILRRMGEFFGFDEAGRMYFKVNV